MAKKPSKRPAPLASSKKAPAKKAAPAAKKAAPIRRAPAKRSAAPAFRDPVLAEEAAPFDPEAYKFVLSPAPAAPEFRIPDYEYLGELPESYGTRRLWLVARDTHFLFAYWDFTNEQLGAVAARAGDGNIYLQLHAADGTKLQQIHVLGDLRHWYLHANQPGGSFYAELGVYLPGGEWEAAARSGTISAPRDTPSPRTTARFVTIPFHLRFRELADLIRHLLHPGEELAEALARLEAERFEFPYATGNAGEWAQADEAALAGMGEEILRRTRVGSIDITEVLRRRLQEEASSGLRPTLPDVGSSPFGASFGAPRDFFMHLNAELVVYGGTRPGASIRINGQPVELRPDGTFTFHFNFPDGNFHIPVEAAAQDGSDTRSALLSFLRLSADSGGVTPTPQTPRPEPIGRIRPS